MTKLLNIDSNAKTVKGQKQGFMTAILYLAPYLASGVNLCPTAKLAGCHVGCLNTAGRGGIAKRGDIIATDGGDLPNNAIQRARLERSRLFNEDRDAFLIQLIKEIKAFIRKAERAGLTPVVRLNGTSDIQWELIELYDLGTLFDIFPDVQFYDYTKIAKRMTRKLPANYHLSLSFSAASARYSQLCFDAMQANKQANVVVVFRGEKPTTWMGRKVIDGDAHDLRFTDPSGVVVALKAKGAARRDDSGFVIDVDAA